MGSGQCLAWWLVVGATSLACATESRFCTLIGCGHAVSIFVPVPPEIALDTGRIRVCRNTEACLTFELVNTIVRYEENTLGASARWASDRPGNQVAISLENERPYPGGFIDGDVYTVVVWNADGAEVRSYRWQVEYTDHQPNGENCEPTCRRAILDDTNAL